MAGMINKIPKFLLPEVVFGLMVTNLITYKEMRLKSSKTFVLKDNNFMLFPSLLLICVFLK